MPSRFIEIGYRCSCSAVSEREKLSCSLTTDAQSIVTKGDGILTDTRY